MLPVVWAAVSAISTFVIKIDFWENQNIFDTIKDWWDNILKIQ